MRSLRWTVLVVLAVGPGRAALPSDLVGTIDAPRPAWRLDGVVPGATVVAFEGDQGPLLMIGGPRGEGAAPALGDICIASPLGWGIRRIVARNGVVGFPAMLRKVVLAGDAGGALHAWPLGSTDRDKSPWSVDTRGPARVGPVVVGGTFVFAAGSLIYSVSDLVEPRWQAELGAPVTVPLASDGSLIFAATATHLTALDALSGDRLWQIEPGAEPRTGLLVTAGLVAAGFADGSLRAYDALTGEPVWRRAVAGAELSPDLALGGPWLITTDAGGGVAAVEALTGEPAWQATAPVPLGSPTIGFGHLFAIGSDGKLYGIPFAADRPIRAYAPTADEGGPEPLVGYASIHGPRLYVTTVSGALLAVDLGETVGPAPWPVPGGTAARNGRVLPPDL